MFKLYHKLCFAKYICYKKINYCISYETRGSCNTCQSNYVLLGGLCYKKISNCNNYYLNGNCKICSSNYKLVNNACVKKLRRMDASQSEDKDTEHNTQVLYCSKKYFSIIIFSIAGILLSIALICSVIRRKKTKIYSIPNGLQLSVKSVDK